MKLSRRLTPISLLVCLGLLAQPVSAEDRDASDPPDVSGPLFGVDVPPCEDNGTPGPNEAMGQSCSWSYQLLPVESDVYEDFSAYWFQMEIDAGRGCRVRELIFEMEALSDTRIVSAAPNKGMRIPKTRAETVELVVDAEGGAPVPGRITQDGLLARGRTEVELEEDHYRFRWTGKSRDKVVIAMGVQLAHGRVPPQIVYSWFENVSGGMQCIFR